ncbi:hypothetical protein [Amycolatopsis suaedae]|uniref:hypothetical protein n=1 Tax=Amycolatopsis suaedae TaxID=2510978 RepID=UPI001F101F7C|nr:hypothetical protein [Amycolatopsis suaedae]
MLRPGSRVGITDVTVAETGLPPELTTLAAWVACIADARSPRAYTEILAGAGLRYTALARRAVAGGTIGYSLLVAEKS